MKNFRQSILVLVSILFLTSFARADYYSCAKMIYKDGWLKTYEYKGNTWGANTKKHGALTSTGGATIENTTSSVDPGVTTGEFMSSSQYSSSWGECSAVDQLISRKMREDYIEQNMGEVKKQIAIGDGYHIDSLAFMAGCQGIDRAGWSQTLQNKTAEFYDLKAGKTFRLFAQIQN
jgi:hypothetical protein